MDPSSVPLPEHTAQALQALALLVGIGLYVAKTIFEMVKGNPHDRELKKSLEALVQQKLATALELQKLTEAVSRLHTSQTETHAAVGSVNQRLQSIEEVGRIVSRDTAQLVAQGAAGMSTR